MRRGEEERERADKETCREKNRPQEKIRKRHAAQKGDVTKKMPRLQDKEITKASLLAGV